MRTGEDGTGCREFYATREEALQVAARAADLRRAQGSSAYRNDELAAFGWTVPQAIQFVLERLRAISASRPIAEAVQQLLKVREQNGCKAPYLMSLRLELERFIRAFPGVVLSAITQADVSSYLDDAQTAGTRNTRRKHLVTLFSFGVKNKWTVKSPAKEIGRLKEKLDVQTLTPEQMPRLLTSCDVLLEPAAGAMRAYIALAGFAWILPEKLHRLDMVRSAAGYSVRGQGGEERQSDVLRHSFASCWLAIHKNRA